MNTWKRIAWACLALAVLGLAPAVAAPPVTVTLATPPSAYQGTIALDVVVNGSGFDPTAKVQYLVSGTTNPGGITVRNVVFRNPKELVTTIDVAETADLASFDIVVMLDDGRKGKGTSLFSVKSKSGRPDSYDGENLGTLPGDTYSDAWGVNASGNVVGRSYNVGRRAPTLIKAFYWNGTMHPLPVSGDARNAPPFTVPWDVEANGISSGNTEIAVGYEERVICESKNGPCDYQQYPIFWTGDLSRSPGAQRFDAEEGVAQGINPAGTIAVGFGRGGAGAVWESVSGAWTRSNIPLGALCDGCTTYDQGGAWKANDAGIVIGFVQRQDDYRQFAYVYDVQKAAGKVLSLPPGFVQSNAYSVSNVTADGRVYVAGWIGSCADYSCDTERGIRWVVDVATLDASFEILEQMHWAEGVTDSGFVAGTQNSETNGGRTTRQTAVLWKQTTGYTTLRPAGGGSDSTTRSMSGGNAGPIFVVGVNNVGGSWTAARWTIP